MVENKTERGKLQKDFLASGTSGVHLVLSTSVRSKRNIPPAAEHLSWTCVHLDVPDAYVFFMQFSLTFMAERGCRFIMNFMICSTLVQFFHSVIEKPYFVSF